MLHLDRTHHSPLSPHTKADLIPSDTPQPDQQPLLSWSAPATDDETFKFDTNSDQQTVADKPPTPPPVTEEPQPTEAIAEPPADAPANADDPKPPEQDVPPSSPPLDAKSPARERSSSLTPPPDSTSPAFPSVALPVDEPATEPTLEPQEGEQKPKSEEESAEVDKASRASTPLSELSSAPDGDDSQEVEKKEEEKVAPATDAAATSSRTEAGDGAKQGAEVGDPAKVQEATPLTNGHVEPVLPKSSGVPEVPSTPQRNSHGTPDLVPKTETPGDVVPHASQHLSTPEPPLNIVPRTPSKMDQRVVAILELNVLLLKTCMEFQARSVTLQEPTFQQYSSRLQSNLAWLAATADTSNRKANHAMMTFPIMQPPPAIEFADNEHIQQLYRDLQTLFQKDIMRRQSLMGHHGSPLSGTNGHLKRERTDEPPGDIANKRRDTGESKVPTPGPGTPSSRRSPSNPAALNSLMPPVTPPHGGPMQAHTNDLMSMGSPSMPPPNMSQGMMNVEQQAATAALAQRRMRAMQQDVNRSVPIASSSQGGMSGQGMAGPSGLQNAQGQMGAGMNQMSIQQMNILQDPTHPIVRFLSQQVPGFSSMPVLQQLHHFNRMQLAMQARNQQAGKAAQHHGNPMQFPQGAQNGMSAQMGMQNGSPTRISSSQQSPMPPQGSFPFANQGGMDPRTANAMGGGNIPLDPQRRQLLLIQQQQQMMRSNAMLNAQQQQRLAQQGGTPHMQSPMLGGSNDGNFPALRSNPSVPGIARSTRTPSDHAPSPLTPQLSGGRSEDLQRAMMQQGQRGMMHQQGHGMGQLGMGGLNPSWQQNQGAGPQMAHQQGAYGMSPPGSAGFGGVGSPAAGQQWAQGGGGQPFVFNAGSPGGSQGPDGGAPGSRQTSATPAPHTQQQQLAQNNLMGDQAGLSDFDMFSSWGH